MELIKTQGGTISPITKGNSKTNHWQSIADDMEHIISVGGIDVIQIVGSVKTPAKGY